jgi:hypothetical protein
MPQKYLPSLESNTFYRIEIGDTEKKIQPFKIGQKSLDTLYN